MILQGRTEGIEKSTRKKRLLLSNEFSSFFLFLAFIVSTAIITLNIENLEVKFLGSYGALVVFMREGFRVGSPILI